MSSREIESILANVSFKDWSVVVRADERPYLQVYFGADCSVDGEAKAWRGRKWYLSSHMVKSEIVQTAFAAVLMAVEHEAREHFLYRGRAVFGPHFDVDALWNVATEEFLETRDPQGAVSVNPLSKSHAGNL